MATTQARFPSAAVHVPSALGWVMLAALVPAFVAWMTTDVVHFTRDGFVLFHATAAAVIAVSFAQATGFDVVAECRRAPILTLFVTAATMGLAVASVLRQPAGTPTHGPPLVWDVIWNGVVHGTVDGVILTVVPMAAVMGDRPSLGRMALAVLASMFVYAVYHFGFVEFRNASVVWPLVSAVVMAAAYLLSKRNPLAPILAHAAMHVVAVLHGPDATVQLPPHY